MKMLHGKRGTGTEEVGRREQDDEKMTEKSFVSVQLFYC